MNVRQQRSFLLALVGVAVMLAIVVAALGVYMPYDRSAQKQPNIPVPMPRDRPSLLDEPTLAVLQSSARIDLRRPLFDPPPPAPIPVAPAAPPPPLTVHLAGTIIEPGHSKAVLISPEGKTELKAVGESSGPAKVLEISDNSCVVQYLGNRVTLKLQKEGTGG